MISNQLAQYYAVNADNYDQIYAVEETFDDLDDLQEMIAELLDGHKVLELACGTAYWTELIADVAESVHATDLLPEMIALAETRGLDEEIVSFEVMDAMELPQAEGEYTAVFAAGWWSHVKREEQDKYLKQIRAKLGKDILLVLLDVNYVDNFTTPIARTDAEGNTYQILPGDDGERYEVLRNYPKDSALRKRFAAHGRELRIQRLEHYFLLSCRLK